ncbi:MAG: hypothetical protein AAB653_00100 [Patescibacteria group bacterium]
MPEELSEELVLERHPISDKIWTNLSYDGIKKPEKNILYYGSVARTIAMEVLNLGKNPNEFPIADIDLFILDEPNAWQKTEEMKADPAGIRFLKSLDSETIAKELKNPDCLMNQIAASDKELFISKEAIKELKTGIVKPVCYRQDIYKTNCYFHPKDNAPIFTEGAIIRLIKFVAEGKAKGFEIEKHNLQIELKDRLLALLKKILNKPEEKRNETLFRLGFIFEEMGIIEDKNSLFDYLKEEVKKGITRKNPFRFKQQKIEPTREAKWFMTKIVKLTKKRVEEVLGITKTILTEYKREEGDREKIIIFVPKKLSLSENFIKQAQEWQKFILEIISKE